MGRITSVQPAIRKNKKMRTSVIIRTKNFASKLILNNNSVRNLKKRPELQPIYLDRRTSKSGELVKSRVIVAGIIFMLAGCTAVKMATTGAQFLADFNLFNPEDED